MEGTVSVFLKSVAKRFLYLLIIVLVLILLLITLSFFINPALEKHRVEIEDWASSTLATNVKIQKITFSWYRFQPVITFDTTTILDKQKNPTLEVKKISVYFSLPKSIWQKRLIPSGFLISGADLNATQSPQGEITLQGFPSFGGFTQQPFHQETKFQDVMQWLSREPHLILSDIDVRYTDKKQIKRFFTLYHLNMSNADNQHTILGEAILHQDVPTTVKLAVEWQGNQFQLENIDANIYLYISGFSIEQWFKNFTWYDWQINKGVGSAKIWASWNKGSFDRVQSEFRIYDLKLHSLFDKTIHTINRISGNIGWRREGNAQIIAADDLLIDLPHHLWPVSNFYLYLVPDSFNQLKPRQINIGYLNLQDSIAFLFSSSFFTSQEIKKYLINLKPRGSLQNLSVNLPENFTDPYRIALKTEFNNLIISPWKNYPSIKNLSGALIWKDNKGQLLFQNKRDVVFQYDALFEKPIPLNQLIGNVHITKENDNFSFTTDTMQILNNDVTANVAGNLKFSNFNDVFIDMSLYFALEKVQNITYYLPLKTFGADLVYWLKHAFLGGEIKSGKAELHGKLNEFPFDKGNGLFKVTAAVSNVELRYADNWPVLQHIFADLEFIGRQIKIVASKAEIFDIPITNVNAIIPDLSAQSPIVQIEADEIKSDLDKGLKFIRNSPLNETIGKLFNKMEMHGPMQLKLGLTVPFIETDKTEVRGQLSINKANLNLVPWRLNLKNIQGQLQFTQNLTEAQGIQGEIFSKPFSLNLSTIQKNNQSVMSAIMQTHVDLIDLEQWLNIPLGKKAKGNTDLEARFEFSQNLPIQMHLESNLKGIEIDLPPPYSKKAEEIRHLSLDLTITENAPLRLQVIYGDALSAALIINTIKEKYTLQAANIHIGSNKPALWPPSSGLYVSGDFETLDWEKINQLSSKTGDTTLLELPLRGININTQKLQLGQQSLSDVHLQLTPQDSIWRINVESPEIVGQIETPSTLTSKGVIKAKFQKIKMQATEQALANKLDINVKNIPAINFVANEVSYHGIALGEVSFDTIPSTTGLFIKRLHIASPLMNLQAEGRWTQSNTTSLSGIITSDHVSDLLSNFGINAHNFIASNGKLNFSLMWNDAPFAPSLSGLEGRATIYLGRGRIVDIGDASSAKMDIGRMLSIFSLQTIPRRLSFDFSDIFEKGYSFDTIRGDFNFKNGDAYTQNMRIDGPVASVDINGIIGLRNKNYDLTISVTPYVTSGIPLAATLLTAQPLVGLAAMAVSTVLTTSGAKLITYHYQVTGPWSQPVWRTISGRSR